MSNAQFSNRWGIIFAALGMAIGAGNLWRFPRLAGQHGGTFILLWFLFLLVWSIPILLAEFAIGKSQQKGVIGAFAGAAGPKYAWMGWFIALCTLGITLYYSVVSAWGLQYLIHSIEAFGTDALQNPEALTSHWQSVSNGSLGTVVLHALSIGLGLLVLTKGVSGGFEKANRILIPTLVVLLLLIAGFALSLKGGFTGLKYMFAVDPAKFSNPKIWIEAVSQSAWSTGAGWGLMLTISSYSRKDTDIVGNVLISGFGNNMASILAGVAILPAVFALAPSPEVAVANLGKGNFALTFNIIPQLFADIKGGSVLTVVFFSAFTLAAFTSLLSMLEMVIRIVGDLGIKRKTAILITGGLCLLGGLPSAWNLEFLKNQDWVWGLGLIISGMFILFAVWKKGPLTFKHQLLDPTASIKLPDVYFRLMMIVNIPIGLILIWWWMFRSPGEYAWFDANGNWNVIDTWANASIVTQWALVIVSGIVMNRWLVKWFR
ncbi:MAG: sodium-dependent transporter [Bacteroidia bacterium]